MNLSLGDPYFSDPGANTKIRNLIVAEAFIDTDYHYGVLQADGTHIDHPADEQATTICCGQSVQQGCGDNTLAYDKRDEPGKGTWETELALAEADCNTLDSDTGKTHVWKTLYPR